MLAGIKIMSVYKSLWISDVIIMTLQILQIFSWWWLQTPCPDGTIPLVGPHQRWAEKSVAGSFKGCSYKIYLLISWRCEHLLLIDIHRCSKQHTVPLTMRRKKGKCLVYVRILSMLCIAISRRCYKSQNFIFSCTWQNAWLSLAQQRLLTQRGK